MHENNRNGQDDSDIVVNSEPFTITRAALFRQRSITGWSKDSKSTGGSSLNQSYWSRR